MNYATARQAIGIRCNLDCVDFPDVDELVKSEVARSEETGEELDVDTLVDLVRAKRAAIEPMREQAAGLAASVGGELEETDQAFDSSDVGEPG